MSRLRRGQGPSIGTPLLRGRIDLGRFADAPVDFESFATPDSNDFVCLHFSLPRLFVNGVVAVALELPEFEFTLTNSNIQRAVDCPIALSSLGRSGRFDFFRRA